MTATVGLFDIVVMLVREVEQKERDQITLDFGEPILKCASAGCWGRSTTETRPKTVQ